MQRKTKYRVVVVLGLLVLNSALFAQHHVYVPFQRQVNLPIQNNLDTLGSDFHPDVFPYLTADVDSTSWYQNVYGTETGADNLVLGVTLNKKSPKNPIDLSIAPIGEILTGFEAGVNAKTFVQTGFGVNLSGSIGKKLDVNVNLMQSNSSYPSFVENFIFTQKVVPGQGWAHNSNLGYRYNNSNGYISYSPGKYFNFTAGRGKNKFGEGYRSLLMSDATNNYNYLRVATTIWKFKYVNLFTQMDDVYNLPGAPDVSNTKYSTSHYLSLHIKKRWSIGFFESINWMGSDSVYQRGFDPYYLNPIIFYRPVEFSLGSPDNVLMGLNVGFKVNNQIKLYGQLVLDEFKLSEIRAQTGWWANKYGTQIGVKYYNAFKIDGLSVLLEYNRLRPYTYSHWSSAQAYGHDNQSIAHPSGANFNEGVFLASFYKNKFYAELKTTVLMQGVDSDTVSYGANIFIPYDQRPADYGIEIGQGTSRVLTTVNLKASYLLSPKANMRIEVNISEYNEDIGGTKREAFWARIGLRTGIFNEDWDF